MMALLKSPAPRLIKLRLGHVTFLSNPRYTPKIAATAASAIFVGEDVEVTRADLAVLRAKDPYLAFTRALIAFHPRPAAESAIHDSAVIDQTATIGAECFVGPNAVVGKNSHIGDRSAHSCERDDLRQRDDRG